MKRKTAAAWLVVVLLAVALPTTPAAADNHPTLRVTALPPPDDGCVFDNYGFSSKTDGLGLLKLYIPEHGWGELAWLAGHWGVPAHRIRPQDQQLIDLADSGITGTPLTPGALLAAKIGPRLLAGGRLGCYDIGALARYAGLLMAAIWPPVGEAWETE